MVMVVGGWPALRPTTNVALSANAEIRGVFGAVARVVLLWGNEPRSGDQSVSVFCVCLPTGAHGGAESVAGHPQARSTLEQR